MLALRIDYLTGRCCATAYNDREAAEWPPHPARVFSALVATWAEADERDARERTALEWLERLGAPWLVASGASERRVVPHFVPVNDPTVIGSLSRWADHVEDAEVTLAEALAAEREATDPKAVRAASKAVGKARKGLDKARDTYRNKRASETAPPPSPSKKDLATAPRLLPSARTRQMRHFPSVTPHEPVVHLVWPDADPGPHGPALRAVAARVTRIGHSSSLVHCRLAEHPPEPNWHPDDAGEEVLRVVGPGQLASLDDEFVIHQGVEPRVLPCRFQRYRRGSAAAQREVPRSVFDTRWIVLRRVGGPRLPIVRAVDLAQAVRSALVKYADEPTPAVLHGHDEDGSPLEQPHLAVAALPFVAHRHADGSLLGVALILPREVSEADRLAAFRALGRWEAASVLSDPEAPHVPVHLPKGITLELERILWGGPRPHTLRESTWCRPSRRWVSATPVALDRNPGDLSASDPKKREAAYAAAEEIVARSCERIGLPLPARVVVVPSVTMPGTAKARRHPPFPPERGRLRRVKVHVELTFEEPVRGPVLLGAGRYLGLGLFRPADEGDA